MFVKVLTITTPPAIYVLKEIVYKYLGIAKNVNLLFNTDQMKEQVAQMESYQLNQTKL